MDHSHTEKMPMKKWMPVALAVIGLAFIGLSQVFLNENGPEALITHIAGSILLLGGGISFVVALVTFFLRDNDEIW
jgi:drug/metabolite transporter (DMT)-like permease